MKDQIRKVAAVLRICLIGLIAVPFATGPVDARMDCALIIISGEFNPQLAGAVPPKLEGTKTDARLMLSLVDGYFGITPENTRIVGVSKEHVPPAFQKSVVAEHATRQEILKALAWLTQRLREHADSQGIVYYSGHGSRVRDDGNNYREYILTWDGTGVLDYEMASLFAPVGARVLRVFDCCHSGGLERSLRMPVDQFGVTKYSVLFDRSVKKILRTPAAGERGQRASEGAFLAACGTGKEAWEVQVRTGVFGSARVSRFTHALYSTLIQAGQKKISLRDVIQRTSALLATQHCAQEPQLRPQQPLHFQSLQPAPGKPAFLMHSSKLPYGWFYGVKRGMVFSPKGGAAADVAYEVVSADAFEATLRPIGDAATNGEIEPLAFPLSESSSLEGVVVEVEADKDGNLTVCRQSADGRQALATGLSRQETTQCCDALTHSLLVQQTLVGWATANPCKPFGLELTSPQGKTAVCRPCEPVQVILRSRNPGGFVLLVAFEPDGTITVVLPNRSEAEPELNGIERGLTITAGPPAGDSILVAFMCDRPLLPPPALLGNKEGDRSRSISQENKSAFLKWLAGELTAAPDRGIGRNVSIKDAPLAPTSAIDGDIMVVRVEEPK